jgi:hypothetical protein
MPQVLSDEMFALCHPERVRSISRVGYRDPSRTLRMTGKRFSFQPRSCHDPDNSMLRSPGAPGLYLLIPDSNALLVHSLTSFTLPGICVPIQANFPNLLNHMPGLLKFHWKNMRIFQ